MDLEWDIGIAVIPELFLRISKSKNKIKIYLKPCFELSVISMM